MFKKSILMAAGLCLVANLFSGPTPRTAYTQAALKSCDDICTLEAQVAFNQAFQANVNLNDGSSFLGAELAGIEAYNQTYSGCMRGCRDI